MKNIIKISAIVILLASAMSLHAQNVEDAIRLSQFNGIYSARTAGLGVAFHGISDDGTAMYYNPAGLSLVAKTEFSIGFGLLSNSTQTDYLGNNTIFKSNAPYLSNVSIVSPFKIDNHNASVAIGYTLEADFKNSMDYNNPNSNSSFVADYGINGPKPISENFAKYLWLVGDDKYTPLKDGLKQKAQIDETGGIHNITGAMAFDLTDNFSIGASLSGKWGTYTYNRVFDETDVNNKYNTFIIDSNNHISNVDFNTIRVTDNIEQSFSGMSGSVGIQGRVQNFLRYGFTIKFPTLYTIEDNSSLHAKVTFDNGDIRDTTYYYGSTYTVTTPWVFCFGLSGNIYGLTLSSGVEFSDASQLNFGSDLYDISALNITMRDSLDGRLAWGLGAEYEMPFFPLILRASYNQVNSAYKNDFTGSEYKNIAFGAGFYVAPNIRLDAVARMSSNKQMRTAYGTGSLESPVYYYTISPINFALQLAYRY